MNNGIRQYGKLGLPALSIVADGLALIIGSWLAYALRFSEVFTSFIPIVTAMPPAHWYVVASILLTAFVVIRMVVGGMYSFPRQDNMIDELTQMAKCYLSAFTLLLAFLFFVRSISLSRLTTVLLFIFSFIGLTASRIVLRKFRNLLYRRQIGVKRAAVVGDGSQAANIIHHIQEHPEFGLTLMGSICNSDVPPNGLKLLGNVKDAGQVVKQNKLDTLIVTPSVEETDMVQALVRACYGVNVDFLYMPDIQLADDRPKRIVEVGGAPLWTLKETPFTGWQGIAKRTFDIIVSGLTILFLSPILLILAALVKLESRGPVLYRQGRIGMDGREFDCLKFRSMRMSTESVHKPGWTTPGDKRVTQVGKFIRRWSLDELPQLFNILRGDMSLVGPRPEQPEYVKQFAERIDGYHERHRMRAGLTGWAQVNGLRGDTPIEARTIYDRYYIENWSLVLDLKILFLTLWAVIKGENAY